MTTADQIAERYASIQENICTILEQADGLGKFEKYPWKKEIGTGLTRVMKNGKIIEKAGVNFSYVQGDFNPKMEAILGKKANKYAATGISSIIHPSNPFVPIIHMNVRYFSLDNGTEWFGGGIDLTPHYIDKKEASNFHHALKTICDKYHPDFYTEYKKWADEYFYIPHREETRGIGGIFYDRIKPGEKLDLEGLISFSSELANAYPQIYAGIMKNKSELEFSKEEKEWQKIRRGRYVEFNLVYDRGTKFGLESSGNTESILVSLPSEASWEYNHKPAAGTKEFETLQLLKKGINWTNE